MIRRVPQSVFFAYRDVPERRAALREPVGSADRYRLFGLDEVARRGVAIRHNLEREEVPAWARRLDAAVNRPLYAVGGYGGDFASVVGSLGPINRSDVVFSTVDTVGIPLALLRAARVVRGPLVYTSIGLPERLDRLRGQQVRALYRRALRSAAAIVAYAEDEVERLSDWIGPDAPPVVFVPFGVDADVFRPVEEARPSVDVVSVGADPRRDFELLLRVAARRPELSFRVVASSDNAQKLGPVPQNVTLETGITLDDVRDRLARARVVALPVRDNSYSGATTTLLQAMAMAKPVVVSRTAAISRGYGLEDGVNCRFVAPGDTAAFEQTLVEVLRGADASSFLGIRARRTVERSLTWERYTNALWNVICSAS